MVGKTRLLAQALSTEATDFALLLWRKRYGSLPLTSFERFHGKRLVVMFDDIQEYASPDEAQGVLDTVERLRAICHRLIIVATSRTGIEQDITERVFGRALIEQFHLRRIYLAPFTIASDEAESFLENCRKVGIAVYRQSFDGTPGSVVLGLHTRTEQLRDPSFPGGARAILQALALLRHGRIYVYPEERVRRVAMAMFGLPSGVNDWRESLRHLTRGGWVDVNRDASGQPVIRLPTDGYLDTCVRDAEVYPVPGGHVDDDLRKLKEVLSNSNLPPDADALLLLSVTLREYVIGDQSDQARLAVDCATTALSILSPTSNSDLWARGKNTLGIAYAKLGDSRFLQAAFDAFTDALSVRTREAFPIKWAETVCNRVLVRMEIANQTPNLEERREHLVAGRAELRSTLLVFEANSERFKNVQQTIAELDALDES